MHTIKTKLPIIEINWNNQVLHPKLLGKKATQTQTNEQTERIKCQN